MRAKLVFILAVIFCAAFTLAQAEPPQGAPGERGGSRRGMRPGLMGVVKEIKPGIMVVQTEDGTAVSVTLTDQTRYSRDRQPAELKEFKVGDTVMVGGERSGDTMTAAFVGYRSGGPPGTVGGRMMPRGEMGKDFVAGELKSVEGTTLTVARPNGESNTFQVDENTSFRKKGESVTLADFKPGDRIMARGALKEGVFVATSVGDLPEPPARRGMPPPQEAPK